MDKRSPKAPAKKGAAAPNRDAKSLGKSTRSIKKSPASSKSPGKRQPSLSPKNQDKKDPDRIIVGNFSFMRDMIKEGGRSGDSRWILGLRQPRPFSSYKKINTVPVGFSFGDKGLSSDKRIVVEFKPGEHPEAVSHLLNHRVASTTNQSLACFETGLRSYMPASTKSSMKGVGNGIKGDERNDNTGNKLTTSLPALKFLPLPHKDRKEFPHFVLSTKELEQAKKKMAPFTKDHMTVIDIFQNGKKGRYLAGKEDELRPNSIFFKKSGLVSVSAQ